MQGRDAHEPRDRRRVRVRIEGTVQGVGFRPHVYRLARTLRLAGFVRNDAGGVLAEVEGRARDVDRFLLRVARDAPPLAAVARVATAVLAPDGADAFAIVASDGRAAPSTAIPADAATCAACVRELFDPRDRRYRYPFINCTDCGPRFTIVDGLPYDRPRTTMARFVMCAACRAEYEDPADRRFHAQPNACPACGPSLRLCDPTGRPAAGGEPLRAAAAALAAGDILAVKGVGGFHLACRADDAAAVARLRARKRRPDKPFAVMPPDLAAARRLARLDAAEERILAGGVRPIVLVRRREDAPVAAGVAPRSPDLGLVLPYSPVHHLLLADVGVPLVMTSGNVSDEPIVHQDDEAVARLGGIADLLLLHDRPIAARADDSIVRVASVGGRRRPVVLRRARGYAPRPLRLPVAAPAPILAVGGELKSTCAVVHGADAYLTPHLGDLGDERAQRSFREASVRLARLLGVVPAVVAHDLHPGYHATAWATSLPGVVRVAVQHHHAHLASCLADAGVDAPTIGVAWDGTGLGPDGHVWGGEFLVGDLAGCARAAHLEEVPMPGGEAAVREPWRMAAAFLAVAYGERAPGLALDFVRRLDRAAWRVLTRAMTEGLNAPPTSSAGRLFDAVAALLGVRDRVSFEAQAAVELEALAAATADRLYAVRVEDDVVRTSDLIRAVVDDLLAGAAPAAIAARFHATLAHVVAEVATRLRARTAIARVALTGGVFQNVRLLRETTAALRASGFRVLVHRRVPPNDGGLALGQAAVAARRLADGGLA
jgi:hydrogenase maturation protein HypF